MYIKSGEKSQFSLSFLSYTVNDVRRKLYMVGIQSTVRETSKNYVRYYSQHFFYAANCTANYISIHQP